MQSVELPIPVPFTEECPTGFVLRYISTNAAPLTGGAAITSSAPFQIKRSQ